MTPLFFGTKRAYYATLRVTRGVLARLGLTPARFDLLHALLRFPGQTCWQSVLRGALGVARSTVSRMLKSLELLGLIRRLPPLADQRQIDVELTTEGRRRVSRAFRSLVRTGLIDLVTDSALSPDPRHWPEPRACRRARMWLDRLQGRLRTALGDTAMVHPAKGDTALSWWRIAELRAKEEARLRAARRRASGDPFDWPAPMLEPAR